MPLLLISQMSIVTVDLNVIIVLKISKFIYYLSSEQTHPVTHFISVFDSVTKISKLMCLNRVVNFFPKWVLPISLSHCRIGSFHHPGPQAWNLEAIIDASVVIKSFSKCCQLYHQNTSWISFLLLIPAVIIWVLVTVTSQLGHYNSLAHFNPFSKKEQNSSSS